MDKKEETISENQAEKENKFYKWGNHWTGRDRAYWVMKLGSRRVEMSKDEGILRRSKIKITIHSGLGSFHIPNERFVKESTAIYQLNTFTPWSNGQYEFKNSNRQELIQK